MGCMMYVTDQHRRDRLVGRDVLERIECLLRKVSALDIKQSLQRLQGVQPDIIRPMVVSRHTQERWHRPAVLKQLQLPLRVVVHQQGQGGHRIALQPRIGAFVRYLRTGETAARGLFAPAPGRGGGRSLG